MPVKERPIVPEEAGIDRTMGIVLMAFFLVVLAIPMIVQPIMEAAHDEPLQEFDIFKRWPSLANIKRYEDEIADKAFVARWARPYTQLIQLSTIGQGNEKVIVGKDGWLFFRPGVYFVTGFPFRSHYVKNDAKVKSWDPGPAIFDFHRQLDALDVDLAVVPLPVKAQIYPGKLAGGYDVTCGPPANMYADEFYYEMRDEGMGVFDLSQTLWDAKETGQVYLTLDTHWTPLGMKTAARRTAELLRARYPLVFASLPKSTDTFTTRTVTVKRHGDNFYQLNLPEGTAAYPQQEIEIEQVIDAATGEPVSRVNPDADIILLGDSFTNIYSSEEPNDRGMRWGSGAGFGEHLMKELGRKINVIAVNGGAPTATRTQLARKGGPRKAKLVVWSFATRELITPDTNWALVPMPTGETSARTSGPVEIIGRLAVKSKPPRPGVDPYPEAVTLTVYDVVKVVSGDFDAEQILAAEWVMRNFKLTKAAHYKVGDVHRLKMIPYETKEERTPSISQVKQLDDTGVFESPYWVESAEPAEE